MERAGQRARLVRGGGWQRAPLADGCQQRDCGTGAAVHRARGREAEHVVHAAQPVIQHVLEDRTALARATARSRIGSGRTPCMAARKARSSSSDMVRTLVRFASGSRADSSIVRASSGTVAP